MYLDLNWEGNRAEREAIERACLRGEEYPASELEKGIHRALRIVAWTMEEWLVRQETADIALDLCWGAYDDLERSLRAARRAGDQGPARPEDDDGGSSTAEDPVSS